MQPDSQILWQPDEFLAGAFAGKGDSDSDPALKFLHGTTTLGFVYSGGIIIAVDSRASMGSYVGECSAPARNPPAEDDFVMGCRLANGEEVH